MNGFRIQVPDELYDRDLARFLGGWTWHDDPPSPVVLDFSLTTFVAPWAAALFAAYGRWLQEVRDKEVRVWVNDQTAAGQFLLQAGLPRILGRSADGPLTDSSDRICSLAQITNGKGIAPYVKSVMDLLRLDDEEMADAIRYSLVELLRNVVQHSRSRIGAVALAVYFPNTGLVDLVVADIGCGIRASLQERYPEIKTDYKAVRFAIQPHVSSTFAHGAYQSMANNAGLGLFFLKEIATRAAGGLFLGSGAMLTDLWGNRDGSPGKRYFVSKTSGWRGTFALVQLRRGLISEFGSLLQECREIAAELRRDPTESKLDFIDHVPEIDGLVVVSVQEFEEDVEAAESVRKSIVIPALDEGGLVVLDFAGIRAATQSFAHALLYQIFRDSRDFEMSLSIASADDATQQAIYAVAAYARVVDGSEGQDRAT